jgi:CRISPR/Cas system-associated exonuclease Cas4 (RecB family)
VPPIPKTYRTLADAMYPAGKLDVADIIDLKALYRKLIDVSHDQHAARSTVLHPSSVGYCLRMNYYQYMKYKPTDHRSPEFEELVGLGHLVHHHIQGRLEALAPMLAKQGVRAEFQKEVKFDPETDELFRLFRIGGTTDGLLRIYTKKWMQWGVIEIKSQGDKWFEEAKKRGSPAYSHLLQSHLYAYRFNTPIIWVWHYNKNNSKHQLYPYFFDEAIFTEALDYFIVLNAYIDAKELPAREEDYLGCKECVYRSTCKPEILKSKRGVSPPKKTFRRPLGVLRG